MTVGTNHPAAPRGTAAALVALVLLGVVHLHPLSLHVTRMHVGGSADTQEMMWRLAWGLHALTTPGVDFQDANNFYPDEGSYATMDYAYGLIPIAAPFQLVTANPLAVYNLTALATVAISAWGAFLLGRVLTRSTAAGVVAAAIFAFNPLHLGRMGQLNILAIQWLPWLVLAARWLFERPTPARGALLAATLFVAITSGGHQAVFAAAVLGWTLAVLTVARPATRWRGAALGLAAIAVAGALFYPLARPYLTGASERNRQRSLTDVIRQSPNPGDLLAIDSVAHRWLKSRAEDRAPTPDAAASPGAATPANATEPKATLFPGVIAWVTALAGLVVLVGRREDREWLFLFAGLTLAGFALSLGIHFPGYAFLFEHVGPLHMIRAPSRFTLVGLLGLAGLASFATQAAIERLGGGRRWLPAAVAGAIALGQLGETFDPVGENTYHYDPPPPVYRWLAEQPGEFAVLELPSTWQLNAFYLVYSSYHWKDLVNGFNASYMTPFHRHLLFEVMDDFPRGESRDALAKVLGLRYLVLHTAPSEESFRMRGHYHARERVKRALDENLEWLRPVWSSAGSTVVELVEPEAGWLGRSHERIGPGRMLRGKTLAFEARAAAAGEVTSDVPTAREVSVRLNGAELTRVPLGESFEAHRLAIPVERVRDGMNTLQFAPLAAEGTDPARARGAQLALRQVTIEGGALR